MEKRRQPEWLIATEMICIVLALLIICSFCKQYIDGKNGKHDRLYQWINFDAEMSYKNYNDIMKLVILKNSDEIDSIFRVASDNWWDLQEELAEEQSDRTQY